MSERERCGHKPPIPWRYSSCIGCVFTQIEQMEREREADRAAILWLKQWAPKDIVIPAGHKPSIQRAQDAKG